jgi:inner membrane protein
LGSAIAQFNRAGAFVFVSGQLTIDDPDSAKLVSDPYQFSFIRAAGGSVTLEAAPRLMPSLHAWVSNLL